MSDAPLTKAQIIERLPNYFRPEEGHEFPADLIGAEIVRFGTVSRGYDVEGGGLVIDYRPKGRDETRRLVLAFNELGMWVTK